MPATVLDVNVVPFQGKFNITDNLVAAATEMQFINDGYTVLFVVSDGVTPNITITSVPDNAGRLGNIGPVALTADDTTSFGPFRPVWWNQAGVVNVTLSSATDVTVAVLKFQF